MSMLFVSSGPSPAPCAVDGPDHIGPWLEIGPRIRRCPQSVFDVTQRNPPTSRAAITSVRNLMPLNSAASCILLAFVSVSLLLFLRYRSRNPHSAASPEAAIGAPAARSPARALRNRASWRAQSAFLDCIPRRLAGRNSYNFQFQQESPLLQLRFL